MTVSTIAEQVQRAMPTTLPPPSVRRALRSGAGLSQSELAAVLGVTRACIARYEGGQREPRGELRTAYAEALRAILRG